MSNSTPLSVSVADAATLTSFSQYEIRKAVNAGELPAHRRGTRIVIKTTDLEAWLDALPSVADAS